VQPWLQLPAVKANEPLEERVKTAKFACSDDVHCGAGKLHASREVVFMALRYAGEPENSSAVSLVIGGYVAHVLHGRTKPFQATFDDATPPLAAGRCFEGIPTPMRVLPHGRIHQRDEISLVRYIRKFMKDKAKQVWAEHVVTKKKKQVWLRKDDELRYPFKESKYGA